MYTTRVNIGLPFGVIYDKHLMFLTLHDKRKKKRRQLGVKMTRKMVDLS